MGERVRKLSVRKLIRPPYKSPTAVAFTAENSGKFNREWLANLPQFHRVLRNLAYVPPAEQFWSSPTHEALKTIARNSSYFEIMRLAMEQSYFFLFSDMLLAADAPLPHVIYEDFVKALTYSSLQNPPLEHFALDGNAAAHAVVQRGAPHPA